MRGRRRQSAGCAARGELPRLQKKEKRLLIHQALTRDPVDVGRLREAAVSQGGLLTDEIRRKVWPKLLGVNVYSLPPKPGQEVRQNHKDYNQVLLDVHRSSRRFPPGMHAEQRRTLQQQLIDIILYVLKAHPELHYYQGYHDIAVTLLLVSGERMAIALLERLSALHLRDFMDSTMDSTKHSLNYLMPILQRESPRLHDFMLRLSCIGKRRYWPATATCPTFTSCCLGSLQTCPMRPWSSKPTSSSSGCPTPSWPSRQPFSTTRASPSALSWNSSRRPPGSARMPSFDSGSRSSWHPSRSQQTHSFPRGNTAPW